MECCQGPFQYSTDFNCLNVELGVTDNKDIAVQCFLSFAVSLNFQLDAVCGVYETGAASMHFLTGHGAQIDQKPEPIRDLKLPRVRVRVRVGLPVPVLGYTGNQSNLRYTG